MSGREGNDYAELIAKLRDFEVGYRQHAVGKAMADAADAIETLSTALDPFATIGNQLPDLVLNHDSLILKYGDNVEWVLSAKDFRLANRHPKERGDGR